MENDTKKLHVLIKNEESVMNKLKTTLLRTAHKMYPSLRLMNSLDLNVDKHTASSCQDSITENIELSVPNSPIMRDEAEEDEEKLMIENETKTPKETESENEHNDLSSQNSSNTLPLEECSIISTPSTSPCEQPVSPSPPQQLIKQEQKKKDSEKRKRKNKKRKISEINGKYKLNESLPKKQKTQKFEDNFDDLISTNTKFMDDYFPRISQNQHKMRQNETESIKFANEQTDVLMNSILSSSTSNNSDSLFGFNIPDFDNMSAMEEDDESEGNYCSDHSHSDDEHHHHHRGHNHDIIEGEVKLSNIVNKWQKEHRHNDANENDSILIHNVNFSGSNIKISKEDLKNLQLFGSDCQIDKSWIVTQLRNYIILIDQHAADERVRVERLTAFLMGSNGPNSFRIKSKSLNKPCELFVEYEDLEILNTNSEWIKKWGFGYKIIQKMDDCVGTRAKIKVYATPLIYGTAVSVDELREILTNIGCMHSKAIMTYVPKCIQRVLASKACRSAVKFGDELNVEKMSVLLKQLAECRLPFQCAHGRPTLFPIADLNAFVVDKL